jgi:hypothetical protein
MKTTKQRLREIIKEELSAVLEAAEVGGATDKTRKARQAIVAMALSAEELDDLIGQLQMDYQEAVGGT